MGAQILRADASGRIVVQSAGMGFALLPAIPLPSEDSARNAMPGNFPVRVNIIGGQNAEQARPVIGAHPMYFDSAFKTLEVEGCEAGDTWQVQVFGSRTEGMIPGAGKTRVLRVLSALAAVRDAATPAGNNGLPLRPYARKVTTAFAGTRRDVTLWLKRVSDGVWFSTGETILLATDPTTPLYDTRDMVSAIERFEWIAAGAALTAEFTVEAEVG